MEAALKLSKVIFAGLGLNSEGGLSLEGLEAARKATGVFAEFYTNMMPNLDLSNLEKMIGKKVEILSRKDLEDDGGQKILSMAKIGDVVLLVPGDPMVATTHVSLRLNFAKEGLDTTIIHGASIISAVCGATGLQNYKFGRSVTVPSQQTLPGSVMNTIKDNKARGLHTLVFLDVLPDEKRQLTIPTVLSKLVKIQPESVDWLAVGVARLASANETLHAASVSLLMNEEFGGPPQTLVFPGTLHFMEAEALKVFCGAKTEDLRNTE